MDTIITIEKEASAPNGNATLINNTQPRFDFNEISWGDSLKLTEAQTVISEISILENLGSAEMRRMMECFESIKGYLAKVCTHVPQAWLAKDAPDNLDWSNPQSFNYIKQKRVRDLMQAMGKAQETEKNG